MLYVITGISGGGKSTFTGEIRKRHSDLFVPVAHTTRPPRHYEVKGQHYHFVDENEFRRMIEEDRFFVWTDQSYGNYLGIENAQVLPKLEQGQNIFLETIVPNAKQIVEKIPPDELRMVFLRTPNTETQIARLQRRGMSEEEMQTRVPLAVQEIAWAEQSHVPIIINDQRERTLERVESELFGKISHDIERPSRHERW